METQKKHIEIHIDIDKAADQLNVQIVAEKLTVGELLVCCLSTISSAASTIADANNEDKRKVLHNIAAMVSMLADESLDEEES
ncbi:hypothetical protein [Ruminococcus sp.]